MIGIIVLSALQALNQLLDNLLLFDHLLDHPLLYLLLVVLADDLLVLGDLHVQGLEAVQDGREVRRGFVDR
jgi:hypothetical protein